MARQDRFRSLGKVFVALALLSLGWPASVVSAAQRPGRTTLRCVVEERCRRGLVERQELVHRRTAHRPADGLHNNWPEGASGT